MVPVNQTQHNPVIFDTCMYYSLRNKICKEPLNISSCSTWRCPANRSARHIALLEQQTLQPLLLALLLLADFRLLGLLHDDHLLGDGRVLERVQRLVEQRRHLVDVDDHRRATLAAEEALEDARQLAVAERHDARVLPAAV